MYYKLARVYFLLDNFYNINIVIYTFVIITLCHFTYVDRRRHRNETIRRPNYLLAFYFN